MAEFIGTTDDKGNPVYPDKTISGRSYSRPPAITLAVTGGFVVLDVTPPPDFDLGAALAALTPKAETTSARVVSKKAPDDQPA